MNTEERLTKIENDLARLLAIWDKENWVDRMVMYRNLTLKDGNNNSVFSYSSAGINLGSTGGKVGLYGVTPVVKASAISAPSGGATVDSEARAAINTIITDIKNIGITD